jgi:hypothetical protein
VENNSKCGAELRFSIAVPLTFLDANARNNLSPHAAIPPLNNLSGLGAFGPSAPRCAATQWDQ